MTDYQKELIVEHKELCARIAKFSATVVENQCEDSAELVNRALQLNAMSNYERALKTRLHNAGICIEGGTFRPIYFEHIADEQLSTSTTPVEDIPTTEDKPGSDFDKDSETIKQTTCINDNLK